MARQQQEAVDALCMAILEYLKRVQDFTPGRFYGSFWSEKGYHGPLLDYHAGGSHHNRGTGSAALALWLIGKQQSDCDLKYRAELGFDWLVSMQDRETGGFAEVQNNEKTSDWERTGLPEFSTIAAGFAIHGLGNALLQGLPPKPTYMQSLQRACHWQLSIEWPAGSGIFPHHSRSPYDTLNANMHAAETLAVSYMAQWKVFDYPINIFRAGALRGITHTLGEQWENGCLPYRHNIGSTINYTSLVLWCLLNITDVMEEARSERMNTVCAKAAVFLRGAVDEDGALRWDEFETSSAKHNTWTYLITYNVLRRLGGAENEAAAERLLARILQNRAGNGLLSMRDHGEEITECAFMQADILIFLLPFATCFASSKK